MAEKKKVQTVGAAGLTASLGTRMLVEPSGLGRRFKTELVGMDRGKYIIVRLPRVPGIGEHLYTEKPVTVRFVHEGQVYGFSSEVVWLVNSPYRLLFLSFPYTVEIFNLRSNQRIECFLPAKVDLAQGESEQLTTYQGVLTNISSGGCQVVVEAESAVYLPLVKPEQEVTLRFRMFGSENDLEVDGKVKNIGASGPRLTLGVAFDEVSQEIKARIDEYIESVSDYLKS
jgi:c-di-GMP-binding flagellar brake protein YcgR